MNYLGLTSDSVERTVNELNQLLSNYHIYYQNLRNFHWNIQGKHFFDLHEKFEELYHDARSRIDEIAERILTLRATPTSKLSSYLKRAEVEEADIPDTAHDMVRETLENHKIIIQNFRRVMKEAEAAGDEGTLDMAGNFLSSLEK